MIAEVLGIDHVYLAVRDLEASRRWYDVVMDVLGFRKGEFAIGGETHAVYTNRHFGFVLRPAHTQAPHDPYAPGLHHFCFRVNTEADVAAVADALRRSGINATEPRLYPEYADDYFATFFDDPDGIRLEVTNYRRERRERHDNWKPVGS